MSDRDDIDPRKIRAASLEQDLAYMRANLGASGMRRVLADFIDVGVAIAIAVGFYRAGMNPWYCLGYFLVRDCMPLGRSLGKLATGVHVRNAGTLGPSTFRQRLIRGLTTVAILVPLGLLIATFMAVSFAAIAAAGFLVILWGGRSAFLQMIGYDFATGRTIADRIARTHLVTLSDLEVLSASARKLELLRSDLASSEIGKPEEQALGEGPQGSNVGPT